MEKKKTKQKTVRNMNKHDYGNENYFKTTYIA